jgi:ADP-ribose pyrophosphatase
MSRRALAPRGKARVLRSEILHRGAVFDLRRDEIIEPTGVRATRELVVHPGSVVVLPVLRDRRIVLVRQFRYATGRYLWELVAGRREPRESPIRAARRELLEETGYRARRFRVFLDVFPTPGFLTERMFILLAEDLTAGEAQPEDDEKITTRAFSVAELEKMLRRGRLRDAKSIAGILYYLKFLRRR